MVLCFVLCECWELRWTGLWKVTWIYAVLGYTTVRNKTKKCTVKNNFMITTLAIRFIQVQRLFKIQYNKSKNSSNLIAKWHTRILRELLSTLYALSFFNRVLFHSINTQITYSTGLPNYISLMRSVMRFDVADSRGTYRVQQKLHLKILSKTRGKKRQLKSLKEWTIYQALSDQIKNRYENSNYCRDRFNKTETILCCSSKVKGAKRGRKKDLNANYFFSHHLFLVK